MADRKKNNEPEKPAKYHFPAASIQTEKTVEKQTFAIVAAIALLIITLSLIFYSFNLSAQLNNKDEIITQLQNKIELKDRMLAVLESSDINIIEMSGMESNPDGSGKVIWDSENQTALLQVANMPTTPENRNYQLWIIRDNESVSTGVFTLNNGDEDNFFIFENLPAVSKQSISAFAVTLEQKNGANQPAGEMYLMGNWGR